MFLELAKNMAADTYGHIDPHATYLIKEATYEDDTAGGGTPEQGRN